MDRPLVFIAAAYEGNPYEWAYGILKAGEAMRRVAGVTPVMPHLRLVEIARDDRMEWERDLIRACVAVVVVGGSTGAEDVQAWADFAQGAQVPVFVGPGALIEWMADRAEP